MNFRAAARRIQASSPDLSEDSSMDPTNMGGEPWPGDGDGGQPGGETDGQDPATPGGPAPYNAADPHRGDQVSPDPLYKDPDEPTMQGADMPHASGPGLEANTLHNARRTRYAARERVR